MHTGGSTVTGYIRRSFDTAHITAGYTGIRYGTGSATDSKRNTHTQRRDRANETQIPMKRPWTTLVSTLALRTNVSIQAFDTRREMHLRLCRMLGHLESGFLVRLQCVLVTER